MPAIQGMHILFDHHIFSWQQFGGVSKYFVKLVEHLRAKQIECSLPFMFTNNYYIRAITSNIVRPLPVKGSYFLVESMNKLNSIRTLRQDKFDVFHPTSTSNYFTPHLRSKPYVATAHDLTIELHPTYFKPKGFATRTISERKTNYKHANRIIAISENTKNDLVNFYQLDPGKIDVIYHGYSFDQDPLEPTKDFGIDEKFVLYVGSRKEYKNFDNFLRACASIGSGFVIVCAGGGPFTEAERKAISALGMKTRIFQHDVNNNELGILYQRASVFVYPSLYEGFGMPILEAFANGCPVALSDIPVFHEVAGDAAKYFDPHDPDSIRDNIVAILNSNEDIQKFRNLGSECMKRFSWDTTAMKTIETYRKITSNICE